MNIQQDAAVLRFQSGILAQISGKNARLHLLESSDERKTRNVCLDGVFISIV